MAEGEQEGVVRELWGAGGSRREHRRARGSKGRAYSRNAAVLYT